MLPELDEGFLAIAAAYTQSARDTGNAELAGIGPSCLQAQEQVADGSTTRASILALRLDVWSPLMSMPAPKLPALASQP